jgi:hypothetical protein
MSGTASLPLRLVYLPDVVELMQEFIYLARFENV